MQKNNPEELGLKELIAIGVGGMIGGGIFSVLGLAVMVAGRATPLAFMLGGILAGLAGYSYTKLALTFRSDGASFTYLERAFPEHRQISSLAGWTIVVGYIGTMALYAFTFGAYGATLLGNGNSGAVRQTLSTALILFFMLVNLRGTRSTGVMEDILVYVKLALLGFLAVAGTGSVKLSNLTPVFDQGIPSVFMAGALIFVAYEGFQLITNAVCETRLPKRNIPAAIYGSIAIVTLLYVGLAIIAVGGIPTSILIEAQEYALAVAVEPALGQAGRILVSFAALLATASAVNATMFGASRIMAEMATSAQMPLAFSFRNRAKSPWLAIVVMTALTIVLTDMGGLEFIAAFSSLTFLLVSVAVSAANFKLRAQTHANALLTLIGIILMGVTIVTLVVYLWRSSPQTLFNIGVIFMSVALTSVIFNALRKRA